MIYIHVCALYYTSMLRSIMFTHLTSNHLLNLLALTFPQAHCCRYGWLPQRIPSAQRCPSHWPRLVGRDITEELSVCLELVPLTLGAPKSLRSPASFQGYARLPSKVILLVGSW